MQRQIFFLLFIVFSFYACEEVPPVVTGSMGGGNGGGNTTVENQQRQVLIEEFTGVRCVNCPTGSLVIEDLLAANGEQLIAVSIHAGEFSPPFPQSLYDFRTDVGTSIINFVGQPFGYPSAVIDRKEFPGVFGLQLGRTEWAGHIAEEKSLPPKVKIDIQPAFDAGSREVEINVTLFVEETITEPDVRLSVMLTETNIIDHQLTPDSSPGTQADYKHKHVLRDMATSFDGDIISEALTAGAEISKSFNYTLPAEWKENDCSIVAFVNLAGENKEVLQAHEVHVVQ
ncbi:MAG TPA: Omp28-related outer membrane protein [Bacteroidetes bacterium]|nr:Omp28-related outer membrane protein [Bacteroidota bacterium]